MWRYPVVRRYAYYTIKYRPSDEFVQSKMYKNDLQSANDLDFWFEGS